MTLVIIFMSLYAIALMVSTCYYHDKYYDTLHELDKLKRQRRSLTPCPISDTTEVEKLKRELEIERAKVTCPRCKGKGEHTEAKRNRSMRKEGVE